MSSPNILFLKSIWSLIVPYWKSKEKWSAWLLLIVIVSLSLGKVYMQVIFNQWFNHFYTSLQTLDQKAFTHNIIRFSYLAIIWIVIAVYSVYLNQMLIIRWRRWLTSAYVKKWLSQQNYYRMQLTEERTDNPDQRISEDVAQFISLTLTLSLGLLSAIVTLFSFAAVLWTISGALDFHLGNMSIHIPGYMVWTALAYAIVGTWFTHKIGRPLINLNFNQQRFEADFRFSMARFRENSENVAFYRGELQEEQGFSKRFTAVFGNFWQIMKQQKRLTWFTAFYGQAAVIFPFVVASPRLFSKQIQLGDLMQIIGAFGHVQSAFSYIIDVYPEIANWKATSDRLITFSNNMKKVDQLVGFKPIYTNDSQIKATDLTIKFPYSPISNTPSSALSNMQIPFPSLGRAVSDEGIDLALSPSEAVGRSDEEQDWLPGRDILLEKLQLELKKGDSLLITGPSGCGKTTLLRTLAGIWPFAEGMLFLPDITRMMFLPQKPYLPLGNLKQVLSYPSAEMISDKQALALLQFCQLEHLYDKLNLSLDWSRVLSVGEQQRIGIARIILAKPDFLFLDESTSALDEPAEAYLYQLLRDKCPTTCVVSVGHRNSLKTWHAQQLILNKQTQEVALA